MVREAGVEPAASRLSIECSNHAELFPVVLRTQRLEPRARLELAFPDYKSGASPTMLTGPYFLEPMERIERSSVAYHATALPLSYIGWSQRGYSKPRPPRYECGALPLELLRLKKKLERVRRIELRLSDRRSDAQPVGHTRRNSGADGDNRNLFSGVEAQGTPYIPRPLVFTSVMLFSCQRPGLRHTSTASLPSGSELDKMPQITDKTKKKKRAAIFRWPPAS